MRYVAAAASTLRGQTGPCCAGHALTRLSGFQAGHYTPTHYDELFAGSRRLASFALFLRGSISGRLERTSLGFESELDEDLEYEVSARLFAAVGTATIVASVKQRMQSFAESDVVCGDGHDLTLGCRQAISPRTKS